MSELWVERFERQISPEPNTGCWLWTGAVNNDGYGHIKMQKKTRTVSRVSFELYRGPIPPGLTVDHLCRQRSCVNPAHLEAVTTKINTRRAAWAKAGHRGAEVLRLSGAGKTQTEISMALKLSAGFVSNVLTGKWYGSTP